MSKVEEPTASPEENGRRRPTSIRDIAALAGVHESTVSRALNPDATRPVSVRTAERIKAIAQAHGYTPDFLAAGLRRGRTQSIGLVVADITDTHTGFVIRGIQEELEPQGISVLIMEMREESGRRDQALQFLLTRRVDALIVMSARESDRARLLATAARCPVVLCLQGLPGSNLSAVTADDEAGGRQAAKYLAELGHRVVAQLGCDLDVTNLRLREKGFREECERLGLELAPFPYAANSPSLDEGRKLAFLLLGTGATRPTGIFVHTDLMAIGAINAFRSAGVRCPEDVSVVGFDDSPLDEHLNPALTSMRVPAFDVGRRAGELALKLVNGGDAVDATNEFIPELVVRESTAPVDPIKQ